MAQKRLPKRLRIEENFKTLQEIVKRFEDGKVDIESGVREYEKAAKIIKDIKKELTATGSRIEEIRRSYETK